MRGKIVTSERGVRVEKNNRIKAQMIYFSLVAASTAYHVKPIVYIYSETTLLVLGWTLQNCFNSLLYSFNKVVEAVLRDFGLCVYR